MQNHVSTRNHFKSLTEKHGRNHDFLRSECEIKQINKESPLGADNLQKVLFAASNPILTHNQLQKIKIRQN
jgi:hypothetical protein